MPPPGPHPLVTRAAAERRAGRLDEAETLLRGLLAFAPDAHEALALLGTVLREKGEAEEAIDTLSRAIELNGRSAAYHAELGTAYLEARRLDDAETAFRRVLSLDPGSPAGQFGLGSALLGKREYDEAAVALGAALAARPDHAETHLALGLALIQLGQRADGIVHCRRAVELNPDSGGCHLRLGMALKDEGDMTAAYDHIARAAALVPELAEAHYQLGEVLVAVGHPDAAVEALRRALALRPDMVKASAALGSVLNELQHYDEAIDCFEQALLLDPRWPALYRGIAQVMTDQRRFDDARAVLERALAVAPENAQTHVAMGRTYHPEGRFAEAAAWHEKALALQPDNADAHYWLGLIHGATKKEERAREIERALAAASLDDDQRSMLNLALGKIRDEAGDYDAAFRHFKAGNDLRKIGHPYSPDAHSAFIDRTIAAFDAEFFAARAGIGSESDRPVFVVGMMRSGTTLVEQILASHPQVFGHGELEDMRDISSRLAELLDGSYPECIATLDAATARELADAHVARLERDAGGAVRSVDKQYYNYARLGLIALLFPRARVVHCVRDPRDTCLSAYFHDFGSRNVFSCDLDHLGRGYRDYARLMAHWRAVLPLPILDVPYEALVADQEGWSRKLVDFLGLPWDERCLSFYRTERPIFTSSLWQVRQPIYNSSIGRWRLYERHLGPLFAALGGDPPA
jgi:tetratricopeptide (TPR) repeat protein